MSKAIYFPPHLLNNPDFAVFKNIKRSNLAGGQSMEVGHSIEVCHKLA